MTLTHPLCTMKQVIFTEEEFDLVNSLLSTHLDEIVEDEFFHLCTRDEAVVQEKLTKDAIIALRDSDYCLDEFVGSTI